MPSVSSANAPTSNRTFPRIAVVGYCVQFFRGFDREGNARFRFWSSMGKTGLRHIFAERYNFLSDETPRLDFDEHALRISLELQRRGLWDGEGAFNVDATRVGVSFSASKNNFSALRVLDILSQTSDAASRQIAQRVGAHGPRLSPVAACATGAHAIALGAQLIQDNRADVMICGAIEPVLSPLVLAAYRNMNALSRSGLMRPFDQMRDGFVPNVGASCVILENAELAEKRGAKIHAYLDGWAMNCDATHMTAMCPSGDSIARAIEISLRRANVQSVDYINAHGTATKLNDETEARGIVSALGKSVPVSSTSTLR